MNREDFPILKNDIIYFDNGATTLKPKCVINKITDYYENYSANAHRGDYDISFKVDVEYENAREEVKNFINAKSKEEALESYHGYNPEDTETIDISYEDAEEIENGEH